MQCLLSLQVNCLRPPEQLKHKDPRRVGGGHGQRAQPARGGGPVPGDPSDQRAPSHSGLHQHRQAQQPPAGHGVLPPPGPSLQTRR